MKKKILVIRYHAFGDLVASLPYLNALRQQNPTAQIDLLTAKIAQNIPSQLFLFDNVIAVRGAKNGKFLMLWSILKIPKLLAQKIYRYIRPTRK